jgi:Fur family iron response transcriptional regulator
MAISPNPEAEVSRSTSLERIRRAAKRGLSNSTLKEILREAKLRPTRQRIAFEDLIFGSGDRHFTAEMVARQAQAMRPLLSVATIYNALRQFSDAGLLREIAVFGSTTWYDTKTGPHCHLFIEETGDLIDMPDNISAALSSLPVPDHFDVAGVDILVRVRSRLCDADESAADSS